MARFQKKPVVIDAHQFCGAGQKYDALQLPGVAKSYEDAIAAPQTPGERHE